MPESEQVEAVEAESAKRFLGLDIGNRRIGVAVSDALLLTAQPVLTLYRKSPREDVRSLARLVRRYGCTGIVAGNPLHMSGEVSPQAVKAQVFALQLGEAAGVPVHFRDERLTTMEAHRILNEAGRPRQEHGRVVDQVAAVLILQGFLDSLKDDALRDLSPHARKPGEPGGQV